MPFAYHRTIHFADTDAAGVVFFANYLAICHEAYEESHGASGIDLKSFFADHGVVVPIARSEAEYLRPLHPGDKLRIGLTVASLTENSYEVRFELIRLGPPQKVAGRVRTEHVCIGSKARERLPLPAALAAWVRGG
jgi:1,4-dihydroxy-2-naphthoyl-CoA hydrolase